MLEDRGKKIHFLVPHPISEYSPHLLIRVLESFQGTQDTLCVSTLEHSHNQRERSCVRHPCSNVALTLQRAVVLQCALTLQCALVLQCWSCASVCSYASVCSGA